MGVRRFSRLRHQGAKHNLTVQTSKTVRRQQNRALAPQTPYVGMAHALSIGRNHFSPIRRFAMTQRYSALLAALFASLMLSQAPAHADGLEDVVKRGVLKVAVPQDFPPFGSVGPDMKPRGLDIDTAKLLADQLKVKLELTPVNSTNRIPFLTTGKVDLVISSLGKNPEREKVIDFSRAYAPFYLAVFGPPDADIKTLDDLKGKTISVTRGAIEDIELTKVAPEGVTIKRFEDNNSTIAAYLAGQVDLIASGNVVMVAISEKSPKRVPALKVKLKDSPVYVGVNKNEPALLDKVNQILVTAKSDGALEKNALTWLKEPLPADL
jgi:polar amino acid transport system substrate-binding protein